MRGTGPYADLLRARFELAARKLGFGEGGMQGELDTTLFTPPRRAAAPSEPTTSAGSQLRLEF